MSRYHYLTNLQVRHLFYSDGSDAHVSDLTKGLRELGYLIIVAHDMRPKTETGGSAKNVYALTSLGWRYCVRHLGGDESRRFKESEHKVRSGPQLPHQLGINDVLVAAEKHDGFVDFQHEIDLKRDPLKVVMKDRKGLVPDGWVHLYRDLPVDPDLGIFIEVDRGTEVENTIASKIAAYDELTLPGTPYPERFGLEVFRVLFATVKERRRVDKLIRWTEAVLRSRGSEDLFEFFYFTDEDPSENYRTFFTTPPLQATRKSGAILDP